MATRPARSKGVEVSPMSSARLVLPLALLLLPATALAKESKGQRDRENAPRSEDHGTRGKEARGAADREHRAPSHHAHGRAHTVHASPRRHRAPAPVVRAPAHVRTVFVAPSRAERRGDRSDAPARVQDHAGDLSIGVRGGVYASGFEGLGGYADSGLGLDVRYRLAEPIGFEIQAMVHDPSFGGGADRMQAPVSGSVELFAFPWARVSPYALAGVTWTARDLSVANADGSVTTISGGNWGPHVGLGLEVALTKDVSLSGDARWIGYVNKAESDPSARGAFQAGLGVNVYF
jgi:hypothetical protein